MKLCKDCEHYLGKDFVMNSRCGFRFMPPSPVDGSQSRPFCDWERQDTAYPEKCGPEAKNWEEKKP